MLILCQTKLCHTLALAAAEAETGLSRPNIDRAFIPVLLELMSDPGSRRGPDVPLQACRALNYFLQVCFSGVVWCSGICHSRGVVFGARRRPEGEALGVFFFFF